MTNHWESTALKSDDHPFQNAPHKTLVTFSIPVLFSLVAEPLTGLVDTAFIARLGSSPMAALGVLLIFAGAQLALTLLDMQTRKELFVPILILGITLASNLAAGFIAGIVIDRFLRWDRLSI